MKTLSLASLFMPQSFLLPLLTLAGLLLVFGLRNRAGSLVALVLIAAFAPLFEPVFDGLFSTMPWWLSVVLVGGLLFLIAGRFVRDVLAHVLGDLIASSVKFIFSSPLRMMSTFTVLATLWAALS